MIVSNITFAGAMLLELMHTLLAQVSAVVECIMEKYHWLAGVQMDM